ncbi:MAG: hypothetical protein AB7P02_18570 [Alphaproteobacteria bacterium]
MTMTAERLDWLIGYPPGSVGEPHGYIMHLQEPRFVLRWYHGTPPREPFGWFDSVVYRLEAHDLTLCELKPLDDSVDGIVPLLHEAASQLERHLLVSS